MSIELLSLAHVLDKAVCAPKVPQSIRRLLYMLYVIELAKRTLQAGVTPLLRVAELAKQPPEMPAPQGLVRSRNC